MQKDVFYLKKILTEIHIEGLKNIAMLYNILSEV